MEHPTKKPKMSSTDGEVAGAVLAEPGHSRYKRRKAAIFLAYCGAGYQGMQKNPGAKTIEGDLEEALFLAGAVPEGDRGCPKRYDWARSARTDKGVSAAGQVVSGRFYVDPPGLADRLNACLPPQIRIFGYKRVTNSFSAKKFCDRRRYVYLLPVFAVDPAAHPDREAVAVSLGSENELAKCEECSERGRKVVGAVGRRFCGIGEAKSLDNGVGIVEVVSELSVISDCELGEEGGKIVEKLEENDEEGSDQSLKFGPSQTYMRDKIDNGLEGNGDGMMKKIGDLREASGNHVGDLQLGDSAHGEEVREQISVSVSKDEKTDVNHELNSCEEDDATSKATRSPFTYGEREKDRFNRILGHFVGSHNFHNFTTRIKAEDPSARRYIVSFTANSTISVEGIEFIRCEVVGQSFMLHQIRKMIGLAVAVMRNCAPESLITTALNKDVSINVPTAPEVGLYLDECMFSSYNNKWNATHEEISMESYKDEAEKFKIQYIFLHIASTETKEGVVGLWLHSLNHRNYPDLSRVEANFLPAAGSCHKVDGNDDGCNLPVC